MNMLYEVSFFIVSLTLVIGGSMFVSQSLGRLGTRLNVPEQLLGFIIALCADSPEISASVVSMLSGRPDVAVGVVFGSNLFNLASLIGVTAVIAGSLTVPRASVLLNGCVGMLVTVLAAALVLGSVPPIVAFILLLAILTPYIVLLALQRETITRINLPAAFTRFLVHAAGGVDADAKKIQQASAENEGEKERKESDPQVRRENREEKRRASVAGLAFRIFASLTVIVLGSTGLVRSTTALTAGWLPRSLLGTLVLAALTGIPNLYTAVQLARRQRGSAVVTEAMNSNNLNILVGLAIPSLIFGSLTAKTPGGYLDVWVLLLMTLVVIGMLALRRGIDRMWGIALIAAYLLFVAFRIYLA
jgi:cation:H+ antiporter